MNLKGVGGILIVGLALSAPVELLAAEVTKMEIQSSDTVKSVLTRYAGKQVKLRLKGGEEMGGVVTKVGDNVVHLSELSGKEFYDAVVSLDAIGAVIVRARGN